MILLDLNDLTELCSKHFSGTILTPAELLDKITKLNSVFEIADLSKVNIILAFGEENEDEDLLDDWTEKGRYPISKFPDEIMNYKFLVYDVVFDSESNSIELMMKGDMDNNS